MIKFKVRELIYVRIRTPNDRNFKDIECAG